MGAANKLLSPVGGKAMVLHPVEAARQAGLSPIVVVTGHQADEVRAVLAGQPVEFAHNPDFADGLSTSLKAGLAALPEDTEAAFILLGDMPLVSATLLRQMRQTLSPAEGHWIVVPRMPDGQWGNPVLLHRRFFSLAATATGDKGARSVLSEHADAAAFVTADAREIGLDIDTPETLAALEA